MTAVMPNSESNLMGWPEAPVEMPEDTRAKLGGSTQRLEACQLVSGPSKFLVFTYSNNYEDWRRVGLGARSRFKVDDIPGLLRFSQEEHAIPRAERIKLASPRYFREVEDQVGGVRDSMEASFTESLSADQFFRNHSSRLPGSEHATITATWGTNGFWMFCTSAIPQTEKEFEILRSEFKEYPCMTSIQNPSAFAMQLGKDFGKQFDANDVRLDGLDIVRGFRFSVQGLDRVVHVVHGPVVYLDQSAEFIRSFPENDQGAVIPFVKRMTFEGQQEYRFTVKVLGNPKNQEIFLNVSDELRELAQLYPEYDELGGVAGVTDR